MDGPEPDELQQPPASRRRRLRTLISSATTPVHSSDSDSDNRTSRLHIPMPSLIRLLTSRRSSTAQPRRHHSPIEAPAEDIPVVPPRRVLPFPTFTRSSNPRFSYIHQETASTTSNRQAQELGEDSSNVAYTSLDQEDELEEHRTTSRNRRRRLSLQMSNFFTNITSPGNRHASSSRLHQPRSRLSVHEPIAELDDFEFRPPTPAEVRINSPQENVDEGNDSEYERGFTPRRRRLRPQPVVGEPHDEDYVRRRIESNRRARRATWGPTNHFSIRESSLESLQTASRQPIELPTPSASSSSFLPPATRTPSILSRAFSNSANSELPEGGHNLFPREPRPPQPSNSLSMFRPAHILRQLATSRRNSSRADNSPSSTIPLAELQRLLATYAAQSSDRDYNGHQETTVDGGTITIYGIRRVNARANADDDDGGLFPPPSPSEPTSEERPSPSRDRPRGPRRIFNFIGPGLSEIDPLPPEFEETFERLRRTRRPRSMFGSGSLRRNGVVEPDVPNTAEASTTPTQTNEEAGSTPGNDETWIFYIVSAVLPEGHPLLSAPSLFTDNPTYEDMLFLDSFLQKPVASRNDLAAARGLYRIHQRSNGDLYASGQEEVEDTIEIATERCLICLSDFEENEEVRRLVKCAHFFHRECVDTWLTEGRNSCPLCRGEGVEKKRSSRHTTAGPSSTPASSLSLTSTPSL